MFSACPVHHKLTKPGFVSRLKPWPPAYWHFQNGGEIRGLRGIPTQGVTDDDVELNSDQLISNQIDRDLRLLVDGAENWRWGVTVSTIIAELPELGTLNRTEVAKLVGVALISGNGALPVSLAARIKGREKIAFRPAIAAKTLLAGSGQ